MSALEEGQKFGRYRVIRRLGSSISGISYEAEDTVLHRKVALKLLHPQATLPDAARRQFFRDMQGIATLTHPNLAAILDYGDVDGQLYIVRRYIGPGSLLSNEGRLWYQAPLSVLAAATYMHQLAQALTLIHNYGYTHSALTFSNILVLRGPTAEYETDFAPFLLADMGAAQFVRRFSPSSPPNYPITAAPEQLKGRAIPASDQYALAVLLYFWLTGRLPFQGTPAEVEQLKFTETFPLLHIYNPAVTLTQEGIIRRALSVYPEDRYPSTLAFAETFLGTTRHTTPLPEIAEITFESETHTTSPEFETEHPLSTTPTPGETKPATPGEAALVLHIEAESAAPGEAASTIPAVPPAVQSAQASPAETVVPEPVQVDPVTEKLLQSDPDQEKDNALFISSVQDNTQDALKEATLTLEAMLNQLLQSEMRMSETHNHALRAEQEQPSAPIPQVEPDVPQPGPATQPTPEPIPTPEPAPLDQPEPQQPEVEPAPEIIPPAPDIAQPVPDPTPFPEPSPDPDPAKDQAAVLYLVHSTEPLPQNGQPETTAATDEQSSEEIFNATATFTVQSRYLLEPYEIALEQDEMTIGHAGSSDILLDMDVKVSRHHALLRREEEGYVIYDTRSVHGVIVNGQKLTNEEGSILRDGDQVSDWGLRTAISCANPTVYGPGNPGTRTPLALSVKKRPGQHTPPGHIIVSGVMIALAAHCGRGRSTRSLCSNRQ